jgi:hypothetical protein
MPFLPRRPEDAPAKATQMKAVIILLVCILIVNLAALVLQFLPMGMRAAGPGMMANGNFPLGGNPPTNQQQG